MPWKLYNQFYTRPLVSSCANGRLIASHLSPTLRDDLHWLPVPQRTDYKLYVTIHRCLHQAAAKYLQQLCVQVTTTAVTSAQLLVVIYKFWQQRTITFGPHTFAASVRKHWNGLPLRLREQTLTHNIIFCSRLKLTVLFSLRTHLVTG